MLRYIYNISFLTFFLNNHMKINYFVTGVCVHLSYTTKIEQHYRFSYICRAGIIILQKLISYKANMMSIAENRVRKAGDFYGKSGYIYFKLLITNLYYSTPKLKVNIVVT